LLVLLVVGWLAGRFLDLIAERAEWPDDTSDDNKARDESDRRSASWLGRLEGLLFFGAFLLAPDGLVIVAGWLAFKVASKWEVWSNIIQVDKNELDPKQRRRIGVAVQNRFLIGTLLNIIIAGMAALLTVALWPEAGSSVSVSPPPFR
jgi:hypothetical protein